MVQTILDTVVSKQNLFDSHCHLQMEEFDIDRDEVVTRAKQAGLQKVVMPGIDLQSSLKALEIAKKYPDFLEVGVGNHPYEADKSTDKCMAEFEKLIKENELVTAVGETGLDYFRSPIDPATQLSSLTKHAKLAKIHNLYLIIHTRETDECTPDALKVLQEQKVAKAIFHCFSGSLAMAQQVWQAGYKTSFSCNVTYPKNEALRAVMAACPPELLLIETDSPYLSPQGMRGERNEPANVTKILK